MEYKQLEEVNKLIKTTDIKGKDYAEVNQRIKAFRMLYPEGSIKTEMLSCENGVCVFKAAVFTNDMTCVATGHAYEKEGSTFINKTSYIENCETSAVGRALGMLGIGIDTSVANYEEVANAIENQEPKAETNANEQTKGKINEANVNALIALAKRKGATEEKILAKATVTDLKDLDFARWKYLMDKYTALPDVEEQK